MKKILLSLFILLFLYYPAISDELLVPYQSSSGCGVGTVTMVNTDTGPIVVLTTGDIAEDTDKRYVTDADITNLGNLSGENSGDNATNSKYSGLKASKLDIDGGNANQNIDIGANDFKGQNMTADKMGSEFYQSDNRYVFPPLNLGDGYFIWQDVAYARVGDNSTDWQGNVTQHVSYDYNVPYLQDYVEGGVFNDTDNWSLPLFSLMGVPPTRTFELFDSKKSITFASGELGITWDSLKEPMTTQADRKLYCAGWMYLPKAGINAVLSDVIVGVGENTFASGEDGFGVGATYSGGGATYYSTWSLAAGADYNIGTWAVTTIELGQWVYFVAVVDGTAVTYSLYGADGTKDTDNTGTVTTVNSWLNNEAYGFVGNRFNMYTSGAINLNLSQLQIWYEDDAK